ncbi:AmpG family muropeptide MFS transporter [Lichenicoccus sp.]|uniref:AmpG family muropeptide MFS transporter n=1 Tax=Lichenicoccus sp. TaxID=2781899 RepID=UPI003D09E872
MPGERLSGTRRPLALMGLLGFASGLPIYLTFFTLQQWMSESGVSLRAIGLTACIGLPYLLKFLWAPLLDRLPPGALAGIGRRRGWLLPVQVALTAAILLMAASDPHRHPLGLVLAALLLAFFSASQDVVIDAWRIESFPSRLQAAALGCYVWGYRIAMQVSGAGAIFLAGRLGWHGAYAAMAACSLLGLLATLLVREPARPKVADAPAGWDAPGWDAQVRARVVAPLRDLLGRPGSGLVVAFVLLFNLGTQMADTMAAPFYHALGFSRDAVALANGLPALAAALLGAAASAVCVARYGGSRTLIIAAMVQMASMGLYLALYRVGPQTAMLLAKVTLEGFAEALATTTFLTYLSRLCSLEYTATQYALLSSMAPVAWRTLGGGTGIAAQALGWPAFFAGAILCALPGILIMLTLMRRYPSGLPPRVRPVSA